MSRVYPGNTTATALIGKSPAIYREVAGIRQNYPSAATLAKAAEIYLNGGEPGKRGICPTCHMMRASNDACDCT